MKKKVINQKGYTLFELLTVIGILSVVGALVVSIIFVSLRGAKKSDLIETLRQNGDTAMTQMVKQIRYAGSLTTPASCVPSTTTSSITITSLTSNAPTTFTCSTSTISSNSASLMDTNSVSVSSCSFTCTQSTLDDPPSINIQFTLIPKTQGTLVETKATIPFQSSVTMRNYAR